MHDELKKVQENLRVSVNCRERFVKYRKKKLKAAYRRKESLD